MLISFENPSNLVLGVIVVELLIVIGIFAWGIYKLVIAIVLLISSKGRDNRIGRYLGQAIQVFLIGFVALFLALSQFLEFLGKTNLSPGNLAHYESQLIVRLGILLVLIVAGFMVKRLIDSRRSK